MSLSDILNPSFLVSLGITLLLISIVGIYFNQKFQEQNHKISSMVGLVSTMAEEVNFVRGKLHLLTNNGSGNNLEEIYNNSNGGSKDIQYNPLINNSLIAVSDDEEEESDNEDSDSDNDNEEDSYEDGDDMDDDSDEENEEDNREINISSEDLIQNIKIININESSSLFNSAFDISINHDAELSDNETIAPIENIDEEDDLKSVIVNSLEEKKELENLDYKKLSVNKLRSILQEKGFTNDSSKLKKPEILKLLGIE